MQRQRLVVSKRFLVALVPVILIRIAINSALHPADTTHHGMPAAVSTIAPLPPTAP